MHNSKSIAKPFQTMYNGSREAVQTKSEILQPLAKVVPIVLQPLRQWFPVFQIPLYPHTIFQCPNSIFQIPLYPHTPCKFPCKFSNSIVPPHFINLQLEELIDFDLKQ